MILSDFGDDALQQVTFPRHSDRRRRGLVYQRQHREVLGVDGTTPSLPLVQLAQSVLYRPLRRLLHLDVQGGKDFKPPLVHHGFAVLGDQVLAHILDEIGGDLLGSRMAEG